MKYPMYVRLCRCAYSCVEYGLFYRIDMGIIPSNICDIKSHQLKFNFLTRTIPEDKII